MTLIRLPLNDSTMQENTGYTTISVKPATRERVRELRYLRDTTTDDVVKSLLDSAEEDI